MSRWNTFAIKKGKEFVCLGDKIRRKIWEYWRHPADTKKNIKGEREVLVESKAYVLNLRNSFKIECSAKLFFDMISSRILFSFFLRQKEILSWLVNSFTVKAEIKKIWNANYIITNPFHFMTYSDIGSRIWSDSTATNIPEYWKT